MVQRVEVPTVDLYGPPAQIGALLSALRPGWVASSCVELDFSHCSFMSAEGVAILSSLKLARDGRGASTEIAWETVRDNIRKQMGRWGLTDLFGRSGHPWIDNAIPILHQPALAKAKVVEYISRWTRAGQNMPTMSDGLAREVRRSLYELFTNIFQHSDSVFGGVALGQYYPLKKQVQICVCDGGVGMVRRVQEAGFGRASPCDAIQWALENGHSTRITGCCPGGLGLFLLREFVKKNGGSFRIYANTGLFWEEAGTANKRQLATGFPGTLIELRLNLRDDVVYCLTSELS